MINNEFIIATHYYGNGSPINMWSALNKYALQKDFEKIESEGFNSIILLIPWSGFHPQIDKRELNKNYVEILREIKTICEDLKLGLIFRIGYLWDTTPSNNSTYMRFMKIATDRETMKSWLWFLKEMYHEVKNYKCYKFSFISWEDFYWPIYRHYKNVTNKEELNAFMYESGLQDYLLEMNSYMKLVDENFEINPFEFPEEKSKAYSFYTNFYDNFILRKITDLSCLAFPELSMELRVDPEFNGIDKTKKSFHLWSQNYYNSTLPIVYYHSKIARRHDSDMQPKEAVEHLRSLLDRYSSMRNLGQKKPFVDQLNYFDDTYALWGKVSADESSFYAENIFNTLKSMSSGYAIWGYKDWKKNILHNPFFYLGSEGWSFSEGVIFSKQSVSVTTDSFIQQISRLSLDEGERYVSLKGAVQGESAVIEIEVNYNVGNKTKISLKLERNFSNIIALREKNSINSIKILVTNGEIIFNEVSIKGRIFSQGFASYDGKLTAIGARLVELQQEYKRKNLNKRE